MRKLEIAGCSGLLGVCLGLLFAGNGVKGQTLALAGLVSVPVIGASWILVDTKAQNKVNQSERKLKDTQDALETSERKLKRAIEKQTELEDELNDLEADFDEFKQESATISGFLKTCQNERVKLESQLKEATERLEELEIAVEEWELQFASKVDSEAERRFQDAKTREIKQIQDEFASITMRAMENARQRMAWTNQVRERMHQKDQYILGLTEQYNELLDGLKESVVTEQDAYLEQIDLLNCKVAVLQQQLDGDLSQPEYGKFGYDQHGRIANSIAEWLWNHHEIPLKVTGFELDGEVLTTAYVYPRSVNPEQLTSIFQRESSLIARSLGLYSVEKPQKLQIADIFTLKVRRERPTRKTDKGSLYRSKEEFINYILSQPLRLRIVGEPGSGKTPTVAVLLSHIIQRGFLSANTPTGQKLPYCIVESCNPLADVSVKNSDDLDFCLRWKSGSKGFKGLTEEYKFRKNSDNSNYTSQVGYVWVADEIDNTMADITKDEAKPFKDALKDGGHINIGVIVMGQSANVSTSKGLSIDDQKMMTNIYIDPVSIRTFLTQYGERFYSKKAVEKALATLEELELEIEEQNEIICDTAREFRIAMVTANRSPVFYQLPYFDSIKIDVVEYEKTLETVATIRAKSATFQQLIATTDNLETLPDKGIASNVASAIATPTRVDCPKCASNAKKNGKTALGVQKYICKSPDCKHGFTV